MKKNLLIASALCAVALFSCKKSQVANNQTGTIAGNHLKPQFLSNLHLLLVDGASNQILLVNTTTGANIWTWSAATDANIATADKALFNPTDAKRVMDGKYVLASFNGGAAPGNGAVALVDYATKHAVFYAKPGYQAHSAEILPDGNVVTASTDGSGYITLFKMDRAHLPSTAYSHQYVCRFVHALVWDKKRQRLYAAAVDTIHSFKYDFNINSPSLTEVQSEKIVYPYADRNAHDLFPVYGEDALWLASQNVYKVDMPTRTVTQLDTMLRVKSLSSGPSGYPTAVQQAPTTGYDSDKIIELLTRATIFQRTGLAIYKARWFISVPFSYRSSAPKVLDMNNDGKTDLALFNVNGSPTKWKVADDDAYRQTYGSGSQIPVPADYDGDGRVDEAVWDPTTFIWHITTAADITYGTTGDIPVPGDYNGDGIADAATWRPSNGDWHINGQATVNYGLSGDIPAPGVFGGGSNTIAAVFRPAGVNGAATNKFYMKGLTTIDFGTTTVSVPVTGDFNGDGTDDIALYNKSTGAWTVKSPTGYTLSISANTIVTYAATDIPCSGDFLELGKAQPAVYRPGTGTLYIYNSGTITTKTIAHATGDKLLNLPYSIRNVFFP